ncbi:MAG: hypothetical protein VZQ75_08870, partial [Candidatus Faecousia sp.]|nr:hypothetical protein [Candidatus Faecousia sp.]
MSDLQPNENRPTVDELIASAKEEYEIAPNSGDRQGFEPDFGHTFDDYGEYEEPKPQPVVRRIRKPS